MEIKFLILYLRISEILFGRDIYRSTVKSTFHIGEQNSTGITRCCSSVVSESPSGDLTRWSRVKVDPVVALGRGRVQVSLVTVAGCKAWFIKCRWCALGEVVAESASHKVNVVTLRSCRRPCSCRFPWREIICLGGSHALVAGRWVSNFL